MKRLLIALLIVCSLLIFTACNTLEGLKKDLGFSNDSVTDTNDGNDANDETPDNNVNDDGNKDDADDGKNDDTDDKNENAGDNDNTGDNGNDNTGDNGNDNTGDTPTTEDKAEEWKKAYDCITVDEALDICASTGSTKSDRYYIIATVVEVIDDYYGKMTVKDSTGEILAYGTYGADGEDRYGDLTVDVPKAGDVVLFYANFLTYNGTPELYSGWIIDFYTPGSSNSGNTGSGSGSGNTGSDTNSGAEAEWRELYDCITVSEALGICASTGSTKSDRYYIIATVVEIIDDYYGKMTVKDSTGEILAYGTYGADGEDRYGDLTVDVPKAGDVVLFYANFLTYNGTPELYSGWIIDFYTPGSGNSGNTGSGSGNTGSGSTTHTYTDFTSSEKALMNELIGFVIPFVPNDEYYLEEFDSDGDGVSDGINFYTFDNTTSEFNAYLALLDVYTFDFTEDDDYGDTWYYYTNGDFYIDVSYYYYEDDSSEGYIIDLYVYPSEESSGSGSGSGSGNTGSGSGSTDTNLPTDADGIYDVDFTKADKVKDVTDQGYYLDGCPTTGSPAVLVIPVDFSDVTAASKGYNISVLEQILTEGGKTDYYSLYDYYYISSYGQLTLDITVLESWFRPQYSSSYYYEATYDYYGSEIAIGDQLILNEALAYLESRMDLSEFDSDNNGVIDSVILVTTLDISEEDFYWAYRYWNLYTDDDGYYYEYDGVSANDYVWLSYQFIYETYDDEGYAIYTDTTARNSYTFIHEFGHVLGVDDYYDTAGKNDPMGGCDVMDAMKGDHNAYSKFNLGWITTSRLVVTDTSVTLTLEDFSKNGDTIIIANNWDEKLGAYQEYYVIMYYTNNGLNAGEAGYFGRNGIVVYHVNATLTSETYDGETYYDVKNNNTDSSDDYGTVDNLIEFVLHTDDYYTYVVGDTLPSVTDDNGNKLAYTFTVDELTADYATITFTAA